MRVISRVEAILTALVLTLPLFIAGCGGSGSGGNADTTIIISGTVTDADTNASIENAQVSILNTETQQNVLSPVYTDKEGDYTFTVLNGAKYEIRVAAQGYEPNPLDGVTGVPIAATATFNVSLQPVSDGNSYGWLELNLLNYSSSYGALVILTDQTTAAYYTAVTTTGGNAMLYNLPLADYNITVRSLGYATYTSDSDISITTDQNATVVENIHLTPITGYSVSGMVTFLSATNSEVDVSLIDPETKNMIPGTNIMTTNRNYSIGTVAPGDYFLRATYRIDGYVVDPDEIVKHGDFDVNVTDANVSEGISVTGAVTLNTPFNNTDGTPVNLSTATPVLSWEAYPSASDYVVEVTDVQGNVIWGGFTTSGGVVTKVPETDTAQTAILYSGPTLTDGTVYHWRVYASKDDNQAAEGWKLISASEAAQGFFKVALP